VGTIQSCTQVPDDPAQWQLGSRTPGILRISRNTGPVVAKKVTLLNPSNYHVCVCVCAEYKYCAISWINYRIHNYSAYNLLPRKILHS